MCLGFNHFFTGFCNGKISHHHHIRLKGPVCSPIGMDLLIDTRMIDLAPWQVYVCVWGGGGAGSKLYMYIYCIDLVSTFWFYLGLSLI